MHEMLEKREDFGTKPIRITLQSGPGQLICPHWHSYFEYIEILEGTMTVTVGQTSYPVSRGDIVFINSGLFHAGESKNGCMLRGLVVPVSEWSGGSPDLSFLMPDYNPIIGKNEEISRLLFSVYKEYTSGCVYQSATIRALLSLLRIYTCRIFALTGESKHNAAVKKAAEFIRENYPSEITVDELADHVNLSKFHFSRLFKEVTGLSPIVYLTRTRISRAIVLMEQTDLTMTEISSACGFSSPNYFNRVFKKFTGSTPHKYKKLMYRL